MTLELDTRLWSDKAKTLTPYVAGEQPQHENLCKLNTNENPFPPSPQVAQAIDAMLANQAKDLRLYPSSESDELRQTLADTYGLQSDQIFVGNGSDEVLALVFASFFLSDKPLLTPDIGYSFYPVYAKTFDVPLQLIPLQDDFTINADDYCQRDHDISGIIIANPNAPTGILLSLREIEQICNAHRDRVVVIDEAYIDFAMIDGQAGLKVASAVNLIEHYDNLVVTQTFSKSRSLAGLRVGMAFANPSLIEALTRMKNSFNSYPLDRLAQAGAIASLQDSDYFNYVCQQVIELRHELTTQLTELGFTCLPSQANFIFVKPTSDFFAQSNLDEHTAENLVAVLREQGIIVRYFNKPRIDEFIRITIGSAEQNKRLIKALQQLLGTSPMNSTSNNNGNRSDKRDDLRFFLKCYNAETDLFSTYRFDNQDDLADFAKQASQRNFSIIDTHISFFDIEPVFASIPQDEDTTITANDIERAEDGDYHLKKWNE